VQLKWTSKARRDLSNVEEYIAQDNPTAAIDVVVKIIAAAETLAHFPETGRPGRVPDTCELVISGIPYIVPYRLNNSIVVILRVYHTSRKWPEKL
jgi:toxin ParE1/3/4